MTPSTPDSDHETSRFLVQLFTLEQVAEALQISKRSVQRIIADGKLKAVRIGRLVRVHPSSFDAFLGKLPKDDRG
jgi:excisionase family DNA binding protein